MHINIKHVYKHVCTVYTSTICYMTHSTMNYKHNFFHPTQTETCGIKCFLLSVGARSLLQNFGENRFKDETLNRTKMNPTPSPVEGEKSLDSPLDIQAILQSYLVSMTRCLQTPKKASLRRCFGGSNTFSIGVWMCLAV